MAEAAANQPNEENKKKVRELPEINIYEIENFGNDEVNSQILELQNNLKERLKHRKEWKEQCIAYNKLGIAYFRLFKFDKAELCHWYHLQLSKPVTKAIPPFQEKRDGDRNEEKIALVNLGCVYKAKREYELALHTFKSALEIAEEISDQRSQARILNNLSNVYEIAYDFESAIDCELKRMDILSGLCDVNAQIKCAAALGSFYQLQGDLRNSILYYEKAVINLRMKIVKSQMDAMAEQ